MTNDEKLTNCATKRVYCCSLLTIIIIHVLLTGCSTYGSNQDQSIDPQDSDKSGYELLYYAGQFRDLSSVMSKKYVEHDYDSIASILVEAVEIAGKVSELGVSGKYENAKSHAKDWMYSDAYWFHLAISGGNKEEMNFAFNESLEYLTLFLNEMERLGYDFD